MKESTTLNTRGMGRESEQERLQAGQRAAEIDDPLDDIVIGV